MLQNRVISKTPIAKLACAAFALTALAFPAFAAERVHTCQGTPGGSETATVVFHPRLFGVDGREGDGDVFTDDFEHRFFYGVTVTDHDPAKPGWTGPQRCSFSGNWGRTWNMPNIRPEFMTQDPGGIIYIRNVPRHSKVQINFWAVEEDDGENDILDFDPSPKRGAMDLTVFVNQMSARTMVGARNGQNDVALNKAKRLVGDGNIGSGQDHVRAFLEFVTNVHPDKNWRSDPVMGKAKDKVPGVAVTPKPAPTPDTNPQCRDYALKAVQQNQQQIQLGCGFKPPVWSNDHQMHFDWCVQGNNIKSAQGWIQKRDVQLASCKQAKAKPPQGSVAACQNYANQAMIAIMQAATLNCQGLIGPRWINDYNAHFNWCMTGVSKSSLDSEIMARNAAIHECNKK